MNKNRPPRMILTRAQLCWVVEYPDNEVLNAGLVKAFGEITPLPIPFSSAADYGTVRAAMLLNNPLHTVLRGEDIETRYALDVVMDSDPGYDDDEPLTGEVDDGWDDDDPCGRGPEPMLDKP
jgi:hypothetical protein